MRALVTGASGFAGRHLIEHLMASGDDVVAIDRGEADLTDAADVDAAIAEAAPEAVYHLGGASDVGASWRDPLTAWAANATGTFHVLNACRHAGVRRVLIVSSADVYGPVAPEDLPLTEESPPRPHSPYAASKLAAETLAQQAWLGHGLETIRVRAFNHVGPGQREDFVVPAIAGRVARNETCGETEIPVGDLSPRRDITDVRDVVRAYRLLVERGEPGELYQVCSGADVAIAEIAERFVALARTRMTLVTDPARLRPVELPVLRGSPAKLAAATGWEPTIPLEQSLWDVLAEWRERTMTPAGGGR